MPEPTIEHYDPPEGMVRVEVTIAEVPAERLAEFRSELGDLIAAYSQWGSAVSFEPPRMRLRVRRTDHGNGSTA